MFSHAKASNSRSHNANLAQELGQICPYILLSSKGVLCAGRQIVRRELPLLLLGTSVLFVMAMDEPLSGTEPILTRSQLRA